MRQYLADTDITVLQNILITPEVIPGNTSVTWNTAQTKSANIEIESGATLTVDATLSMMPGTYIIVKRGGRLIVNSTITAACSGMWGGIIVEGNSEAPQKEANGQYSTSQGRLTLNSSGTIEHAIWGVGVHSFDAINDIDDADYGGGIVELKGKIRNCTHSVRFLRYRDHDVTTNTAKPNVSYISGAQITLTDDYRGVNQPKPVMLYMREINRLSIAGAWFYDLRTQGCVSRESRADGLVADDARFGVNLSNFRNLDNGIIASPSDASSNGTYTVRNSYFRTCFTGIYSALSDIFTIENNDFQVDRPSVCPVEASGGRLRGIYLPGYTLALGISIADNNFSSTNDPQADEFYFGIECINTGQAENFISKNTFDNLDYANRATGNNGGATGLRYECNEFDGNDFADFYVSASGSVRTIQGDLDVQGQTSTAAGNKFMASSFTWQNDGSQTTTYYYDGNDPQQDPVTQGATDGIIALLATQPNPKCGTGTGGEGPFPLDEQTLSNLKSNFFQQKSDWLTKRAILPTLTGTAAQNLQREIDAHRSAMDITGGKVLRNFSLDSTGVKVDSVLLWTKHLQRYESDMRLARQYFFNKDFSTYDNWLTQIPTRNATTAVQSDELTDFTLMMAVMRPGLQAGVSLYGLSTSVLDSLELWASDCTEPGFIAKEILRRNGRKAISECDNELEERQSSKPLQSFTSDKIRLYPNPAGNHVYMEVPEQDLPASINIIGLDGRIVLQKTLTTSGQMDISNLPLGFYLCWFTTRSDTHFNHKLIISR
ncbi:MAG: hypothetical protein OHK0019_03470 [Saprospiraceae bacterium]